MRDLATFLLSFLSFSLLRVLPPLFQPLPLRLISLFDLLLCASLRLETSTRLANPRVAGRPMLGANPFLPALDVDSGGRFPPRRIVSCPRIGLVIVLVASRGPVASSSLDSLRVIPGHIIDFFLFFLEVV